MYEGEVFKPIHAIFPFFHPFNTLEILWFSDVFKGYRN